MSNLKNTRSMLSFNELCEVFALGKTAMCAAKRRGELPPCISIGRVSRWHLPTVLDWIKEKEEKASIDPIYEGRARHAVGVREGKRTGRPTKKETVEGRNGG